MSAQEQLRQAIDEQENRLRANIPSDRAWAILALLRIQDRLPNPSTVEPLPDLITGHRLANPGGNKALQLCLESREVPGPSGAELDVWAERLLEECARLAETELVLAHCETAFMRLVDDGHGTFDAWIATKRAPARWRERADIDWWAAWLAKRHEPELRALQSGRPDPRSNDAHERRLASVHLKMMAYQLGYPPDAAIGGCTFRVYCNVLGWLINGALQARGRGEMDAQSERSLVTALASDLRIDPAVISRAISAFTLDRENVAWHAAVPGVAAAPLVRVDADRLVWSIHGLTAEPLLFLTRELRRRAAQEYHNAAHLREGVFRQDLYALFQDRRFVTSPGRIELRRQAGGEARTDVDAVVFDRKSGTLAFFELKSQDPFARSTAELTRQRDTVLHANRQISGALEWLQRHGANELLNRVDSRTAKTFRVQKVYPFVLGRYLIHFGDGPEPDRRAAWGTWPQLLRLLDGQPLAGSNPLASLFTRLTNDTPPIGPPADLPPREIPLGPAHLTIHPSYAAFQASTAEQGRPQVT